MLALSLLLLQVGAPKAHVSLGKVTARESTHDLASNASPGLDGALSLSFSLKDETLVPCVMARPPPKLRYGCTGMPRSPAPAPAC